MTIRDWPMEVCQTIDALHAMPPSDRAIVRTWLNKQDYQPDPSLLALRDRCREIGTRESAAELGITPTVLYGRLARAGILMRDRR